jgi:tRNA G46 methylase TrmB
MMAMFCFLLCLRHNAQSGRIFTRRTSPRQTFPRLGKLILHFSKPWEKRGKFSSRVFETGSFFPLEPRAGAL